MNPNPIPPAIRRQWLAGRSAWWDPDLETDALIDPDLPKRVFIWIISDHKHPLMNHIGIEKILHPRGHGHEYVCAINLAAGYGSYGGPGLNACDADALAAACAQMRKSLDWCRLYYPSNPLVKRAVTVFNEKEQLAFF